MLHCSCLWGITKTHALEAVRTRTSPKSWLQSLNMRLLPVPQTLPSYPSPPREECRPCAMATGHKRDNSGNIVSPDGPLADSHRTRPPADSATKPARRFECTYEGCGKSYTRAEHLGRHQLNHNPKDIYKCDFPGCKRQFVRQDLCIRHRERHDAPSGKAVDPTSSDDEDGDVSTRRVGRPRLSSLNRNGSSMRMGDGQALSANQGTANGSGGGDGKGKLQHRRLLEDLAHVT